MNLTEWAASDPIGAFIATVISVFVIGIIVFGFMFYINSDWFDDNE
jgi:hypothetical protein